MSLVALTILTGLLMISEALPFLDRYNVNGILHSWIEIVKRKRENQDMPEIVQV